MIFPIRDENPSGTFPLVTVAIVAANVLVFLYEMSLGEAAGSFIETFGVVPARVVGGQEGVERIGISGRAGAYFPFVTAMFLHGGIGHLVGNMWLLWLAGDNIEDRIGHGGFILFYLASGIAASAAHVLLSGPVPVPMIGASGAISGVLGAYLVCFPRARVVVLMWLFIFISFIRVPASFLIVFWFAIQMLSAMASDPRAPGIAWWAHIGGFATGAALILFWPRCKRMRQSKYEAVPDRWLAGKR